MNYAQTLGKKAKAAAPKMAAASPEKKMRLFVLFRRLLLQKQMKL